MRKYMRAHYDANKQKYLAKARKWSGKMRRWWAELKKNTGCSRCPENHPVCIQFHHPNRDKEATISEKVNRWSRERILAEVRKCIPLCANCHIKEHHKDVTLS
jgi:hypothetical protein